MRRGLLIGAAGVIALVLCAGAAMWRGVLRCPMGMAYLPAAKIRYGSNDAAKVWARGPGEAFVAAFCMDRYEYPNERGAKPLNYVNWFKAGDLCEAEGKRLCDQDEWDRACGGPDALPFSFGHERVDGRCNWGDGSPDNASPRRPSGSFPGCVSPEGVYDLDGNLSEWTATPYDQEPYRRQYILRGGTSWWSDAYGQDCTSLHTHFPEDETRADDGLRCCARPRY